MIKIDELKSKLRDDFSNRIRNLYIKNSCERCGEKKDLELHHHKKFLSTIINESLEKLGFQEKQEFAEAEFYAVRGLVSFQQLNSSIYMTLCLKCHDIIHTELALKNKNKKVFIKKKKKETTTNYCTMQLATKCINKEGILPVGEFYSANSTFYKNGRYNICKNCLKEYVYEENNINVNKLRNILRIYDIPFFEKEWESALNDKRETIGIYFKNVYLNHSDKLCL